MSIYIQKHLIELDGKLYEKLFNHPQDLSWRVIFNDDNYDYIEDKELLKKLNSLFNKKNITYNQPFEVTKEQYNTCVNRFNGICAGRQENGKYFIKVLFMKYSKEIKEFLKNNND